MIEGLQAYEHYRSCGLVWMQRIPEHWTLPRLGSVLQERRQTNDQGEISEVLSVLKDVGVIPYELKGNIGNKKSEDTRRYKIVCPDDIVLNSMNVIIGSVGRSRFTGCLSPVYYVMRRQCAADDPRYLAAIFSVRPFQRSLVRIGNGILAHRMRIPMELLKREPIPMPPPDEQAAIVKFLDHADRRIRRYIRAKQQLIKLLEEQKQAIIHRAVTRGLDGGRALRSTDSPWFGRVPQDWEVAPLGRVVTRVVDGPHHSPEYVDEGIPFLSARNVKVDRWSLDDVKFISVEDYHEFSRRVIPETGDVLYTKGGTTGVARAVDLGFRFQIWVHIAVLKLRKNLVLPRFLAHVLNSPRCYEQSQLFTRGATNQDLGLGRLRRIEIPLPPLEEQRALVDLLDRSTESVAAAVERARRQIALLREYRTRLIADVVTGQLDVRAAAARLPDLEPDEPLVDRDAAADADDPEAAEGDTSDATAEEEGE